MIDDFDFLRDDDDNELPDWLTGSSEVEDDEPMFDTSQEETFVAPTPVVESAPTMLELEDDLSEADEFDLLRERTARASEAYDGIEEYEYDSGSSGGFLAGISSGQRIILALLFFLNIAAAAWFVLTLLN